ncbi:flippase [Wenzhouxiangella sp. XN201]|uniref:flippase n=1 Tax=Wenzhouxiangella sp. XN201 TaxID=2710755 RepID=UPI0013CC97FA|nr:flippase [Wenzhouxiangella sp. XN201]NEZ03430.1 flippase [Wenzhouxiangella sp. XN201]
MRQWQGESLAAQLLRGGAGSLLARVSEVLLGLVVVVLLARLLGPAGYGVYAFVFALIAVVSVPVRLGLPSLVVRETVRGQRNGDWGAVRGVWCWANGVVLALSLFVALVGLLGVWAGWAKGETLREALPWGFALIPVMALGAIRSASLRGLRHTLAGVIPEQVLRPTLMVVLLAAVMILSDEGLSPDGAMALMFIVSLMAFLVGALLLRRYRPWPIQLAKPVYHHGAWLRSSWPMAFTEGAEQFMRHADVLMLGLMAATVDVGVYRLAAQGALIVSLALLALNTAAAPFVAKLYAQGDYVKLQRLVTRLAQAALVFALLICLGFILSGDWLLSTFFGEGYASALWPLLILGVGQVANAGFGATGMVLNMTGHEREVSRAVAVAAVVNIVLNLLLIPPLGVIGAAIATSMSLVFWNVWLWLVARWRLKIRCSAF